MNEGLPLEDRVRKARAAGATYRELCKRFKLSPNQIKPILNGAIISSTEKLKKQKNDLKNEIKKLEISRDEIKSKYFEYLKYQPYFDAIEAIKKVGGLKTHVLYTWWDWMKRSGISVHDMKMFFKRQGLKQLEAELERLDNEVFNLRMGKKPRKPSIFTRAQR